MAEYIDREATKRAFQNFDAGRKGSSTLLTPDEFAEYLDEFPAADVVPVVRCKDCEWFMREHGCPIEASGYHRGGRSLPVENDFCSYGERKDGGADND